MDANIKFIIYYTNKKDDSLSKTYTYNNLTTKIIDIKKEIFNDFPKSGFNYVDLEYVSDRIYKEIGKYSFNYVFFLEQWITPVYLTILMEIRHFIFSFIILIMKLL